LLPISTQTGDDMIETDDGSDRLLRALIRRGDNGKQIGQRQTAPRRAQYGEPCNAIRGLRQCMRKRCQIAYGLPLAEYVEIDRLERNAAAAQSREDLRKMAACTNQNSGLARACAERGANPRHHRVSLLPMIAKHIERDLRSVP